MNTRQNQPDTIDDAQSIHQRQQREYAAKLVDQQRSSILTRIHTLLGDDARRLTDTEEILSTALRRVDRVILSGKLMAQSDEQLYAFVHAVIKRTILEKSRASRRLTHHEQVAQRIRAQVSAQSDSSSVYTSEEIERLGQVITNPIDREIILLRGRDLSFTVIAEMMQMDSSAVRMRWSRIRQRVREVTSS